MLAIDAAIWTRPVVCSMRCVAISTWCQQGSASVPWPHLSAWWPCCDAGSRAGLALPYRGQAVPVLPTEEEMAGIPEGVCRAIAVRNRMTRSVVSTDPATARHAALGLPAYVQFTSPIRRYADLLAHYQVCAKSPCTQDPSV